MKVKKTAKVICRNGSTFWLTQKRFWMLRRLGIIRIIGDAPLTGRVIGSGQGFEPNSELYWQEITEASKKRKKKSVKFYRPGEHK